MLGEKVPAEKNGVDRDKMDSIVKGKHYTLNS